MSKKQNRVMAGLLSLVGGVLAFFGVRAWMNRTQSRSGGEAFSFRERQEMMDEDVTTDAITDVNKTNLKAANMAMEESATAATGVPEPSSQGIPADRDASWNTGVYSQVDTGANMPQQADAQPGMFSGGQAMDMPQAGVTSTGETEVGENYSTRLEGERDQVGIPATGVTGAPVADMDRTGDRSRDMDQHGISIPDQVQQTDQPVMVGSLVGPLIVHLLSFHNMMTLLQTRRDTANAADSNPTTPDVRAGGADAVGSLEGQVPEFDHNALVQGSLQASIVHMMDRIRDMLQNTDNSEDDLFRFSDQLRPAVCKIMEQIHQAQEDNVTGFQEVKKAYNC